MDIEHRSTPYDHAIIAGCLQGDLLDPILNMFESASWHLREEKAYRYDSAVSVEMKALFASSGTIARLHQCLSPQFPISGETAGMQLHRYKRGAGIAPHTDDGASELRVILNLNRGWSVGYGGIWLLTSDPDRTGPRRYVPPLNNCGFAFPTSARSYHAMTTVEDMTLYAAIIAFRLI